MARCEYLKVNTRDTNYVDGKPLMGMICVPTGDYCSIMAFRKPLYCRCQYEGSEMKCPFREQANQRKVYLLESISKN
jgi:hypothetical protein